jgi:hypothetical protein
MKCPKCGTENPDGAKFCNECVYDLRMLKEAKPFDYDQPHSYTPKHLAEKTLNGRSSVEGERKIVTVLFADVANSTAMFESLDPEQVHEILDGCFRILLEEILRYEGTINQFPGMESWTEKLGEAVTTILPGNAAEGKTRGIRECGLNGHAGEEDCYLSQC